MRLKFFIIILLFIEPTVSGKLNNKQDLNGLDAFLMKKDSLSINLNKASYFGISNSDSCEKYLKLSLELARQINDYKSQTTVLSKLISLYKEEGETKKVSENEEALISVNKYLLPSSGEIDKIKILYEIASGYEDSNTDSALYYYNEIISVSKKYGEWKQEAYAHLNTGFIFSHIEDNSKALDEFREALNLFEKKHDKEGMAQAYQAISKVFSFFGDRQNALDFEKEAAKNYAAVNDRAGFFKATRHLGEIYLALGDSLKSLSILNSAVESALAKKEFKIASSLYQSIGYYYIVTKNYAKAIEALNKGLYLRTSRKEAVISIINNYNSLGDAYFSMKDYRNSLENYKKALELLNNPGSLLALARTQENIGVVYSRMGNNIKSLTYLRKSITNYEAIGNRYGLLSSYSELINVYENLKNYKSALQYFEQYTALKDSIEGSANQNKISQFRNIYEREKKAKEIEELKTENQKFVMVSTVAITLLLLIVLLVLLSRYKIKNSSNKILIGKNNEIDGMLSEVNELNSALKISEATYRNLFERNPMPMMIWEDSTRNIIAVNTSLINHYDYSKEEFLSMRINDMRPAEYMPQLEKRFENNPFDLSRIPNIKHKKKSNELIDVEIMSHSFLFEGKKAHSVMIQDVTNRKEVEQAVMDSEERYRSLFEGSPDAIILIDYKLNVIKDANPAAIKLFCRTWADLVGTEYWDLFPTAFAGKVKEFFSIISQNITPEILETEINLGDSTKSYVEISGILVSLSDYPVYQIYIRDISARKETERALRESEIKLIKIQNIVQLGNWELDLELKTAWISEEACSIMGIEKPGNYFPFNDIMNMVVNEDYDRVKLAFEMLVSRGTELNMDFGWFGTEDNKVKFLHSNAELVLDKNGIPVKILGTLKDITLLKQYQDELLRAKEKAELSNRRKSDFLAQMSHEIRSPVNTILSFASLVRDELSDKASCDMKMCFNAIDNGGRRLIRTIDLVLNVADIQTGKLDIKKEKINLAKDIMETLMLEFISAANSKSIKLELVNKLGEKKLFVDRYTVTQIFANLIDNAIKYTGQGVVTIELSGDSQFINVSVADTGKGISQEYLPRLFDPFTQEEQGNSKRLEGTGLGLSLVKKYCELNEAEIKVESTKGIGTKFIVVFRAHKQCLN